jgi:nucleotide-binding universal stress UspA family protein
MVPIRKILHPTDFSERSDNAFRLACALARDYHATVILLHANLPYLAYGEGFVVPPLMDEKEDLAAKLKALGAKAPNVAMEQHLVEGDPAHEILRIAREAGCDLIVMGTHGSTGLTRLLMGSVAEQVVRKAPCPVLTVKTPFPVETGEKESPTKERREEVCYA